MPTTAVRGRQARAHALDGLRAVAVLLVFASHAYQSDLTGGFVGVDVFFVLSGYLIALLLLREHERNGTISLRRFYVRRGLRLYPALVVVVAFATLLAAHKDSYAGWNAVAALTYVTDIYASIVNRFSLLLHTWSLSVEEQFYLLWPLVLLTALKRGWNLQRLVVGLMVASVGLTALFGIAHIGHVNDLQFLPFAHVAEIGAGILLAFAVDSGRLDFVRRWSTAPIAWGSVALLVVGLVVLPSKWWAFPLVVLICWPPVAHVVTRPGDRLSRLLASPPAVWLGERSYAFYLWHYVVLIEALKHLKGHRLAAVVVALVTTLVLTDLSWRIVERRFLRIKRAYQPVGGAVGLEPASTTASAPAAAVPGP